MRSTYVWLAAGLFLAPVLPVSAQSTFFGGANPQKLNFQPINMSTLQKTPNLSDSRFFKVQTPTNPKLGNFTPNFNYLSNRSFINGNYSSPILSTKNNPYQPNPPAGNNWFGPKATVKSALPNGL